MNDKKTKLDQNKESRVNEKNLVAKEKLKYRIFIEKRNNSKSIVVRPR